MIQDKIHTIRNQKVMFDFDLAELYQVETRALKQAVRRNLKRFPTDFMFELTREEYNSLRSQIVTLEKNNKQQEDLLEVPGFSLSPGRPLGI